MPPTAQQPLSLGFRVLLAREDGYHTAHILDFDVVGQGETRRDALHDAMETLVGEIGINLDKGRNPLDDLKPAPDFFWRRFETAEKAESDTVLPRVTLDLLPIIESWSDIREAA